MRDVKILRDRETGESRGCGFVTFDCLSDARDFMETRADLPMIHGQRVCGADLCFLCGGPAVQMKTHSHVCLVYP